MTTAIHPGRETRPVPSTADRYEVMSRVPVIGMDIETTGLQPYKDKTAVVSLSATPKAGIDPIIVQCPGGVIPDRVKRILNRDDVRWITHNGTNFDWLFLANAGIKMPAPGKHYDTMVAEQVLATTARRDIRVNLAATMQRRIGKNYKTSIDHSSWMSADLTEEQLQYAAGDVRWLHDIQWAQEKLAVERSLPMAMANEQVLTSIVMNMINNGMPIDARMLNEALEKEREQDRVYSKRLVAAFGTGFNPRSPTQVLRVLRNLGMKLDDTNIKTLIQFMEHPRFGPLVWAIVRARQARKRSKDYGPDWQSQYIQRGRVHGKYWQVSTDTTRFSSSDPNMQQVPRALRHVFGNEPGLKVVSADYSQIEARLGASHSNDRAMIHACESEDLHWMMAQAILQGRGIKKGLDRESQRQISKWLTYTWVFGGGVPSVQISANASGMEMSDRECQALLNNLNARFPSMAQTIRNARNMAKRPVVTLPLPWGHRRVLTGKQRSGSRILNTRIQGTAAIGMKQAMLNAWNAGLGPYMAMTVHDELVCASVPEAYAEEVERVMVKAMVDGMESVLKAPVRIDVESNISDGWTK